METTYTTRFSGTHIVTKAEGSSGALYTAYKLVDGTTRYRRTRDMYGKTYGQMGTEIVPADLQVNARYAAFHVIADLFEEAVRGNVMSDGCVLVTNPTAE